MKKTLIAASLLSAFACGAYAADVQVYGLIDTSLSFVSSDADTANSDRNNSLTMENAQQYGSRFGLRGSEDLGNGMKVSFVLENGFKSDSGEFDSGEIFGREANLTISGDFGALTVGRMPIFGSVLGANGLFRAVDPVTANYTKAFGSGYATASLMTRVDNGISYKTPTFAGFTGYAMYSTKMAQSGTGEENEGSADRYASLAARYQAGSLEAILVADRTMYSNVDYKGVSDGKTVTIGGNYTLPNGLKFLTFYQWFDSQQINTAARAGVSLDGLLAVTGITDPKKYKDAYGFVDGFGLSFGLNYPIGNGVAKFGINYRDMDNQEDVDFKRFTTSAGYDYLLSKRTTAYVMGGYSQEKIENNKTNKEATPNGYQIVAGLIHRF